MRTGYGSKKIIIVLITAALLAMVLVPAAVAESDGPISAPAHGETGETADGSPKMASCCQMKAENAYMFGVFSMEETTVDGRFLEFGYTEGALYDYTVTGESGVLVFESVEIQDFQSISEPKMDGAVFTMDGDGVRLMAHNNPTGMLQITSVKENVSVKVMLELAEGMVLVKSTNGTYELAGSGMNGLIRTGGADLSVIGSTVEIEIGYAGHMMFSAMPQKGYGSYEYRRSYMMALMNGSIDTELNVVTSNGMSLTQKFEYQGKVQMQVRSLNKNKICVMVESHEHKGKVVSIGVDRETMGYAHRDQVRVKIDGKELKRGGSADEVLECSSETEGLYWVEESPDGLQALVYVPHFSEHEIVIEKIPADEGLTNPIIIGLICTAVLALIITHVLVVDLKNRK